MVNFGQRIKQLREEGNLTQEELAAQLQVKRSTLAKWETDEAKPNFNIIKGIANFFNVTTDFFSVSDEDDFVIPLMTIAKQNQNWMNANDKKLLLELFKKIIEAIKDNKKQI